MKTFVGAGLAFGFIFGLCIWIVAGWRMALGLGALSGALFGAAIAVFAAIQRTRLAGYLPLAEGEYILREGPANHFVGMEGVGGWLYLTNKRLCFRSHGHNIQDHEWSVALHLIESATPAMTARIIPNGLLVHSRSGPPDRFVVDDRKAWAEAIMSAVHEACA